MPKNGLETQMEKCGMQKDKCGVEVASGKHTNRNKGAMNVM